MVFLVVLVDFKEECFPLLVSPLVIPDGTVDKGDVFRFLHPLEATSANFFIDCALVFLNALVLNLGSALRISSGILHKC